MFFNCCAGAEGGQEVEPVKIAEDAPRSTAEPAIAAALASEPEPTASAEEKAVEEKATDAEPVDGEAAAAFEEPAAAAAAGALAEEAAADVLATVNEFTIRVIKTPGSALGLDLDLLDGKHAQVVSLKPGLIQAHNEQADPSKQVKAGDYIRAVNGVEKKPDEFINKFKQETEFEMKIVRPYEFLVTIIKNGVGLGMDLNYATTSASLLVLKVNTGRISEWNEQNPGFEVRKGDRIVAVNGSKGAPMALLEQIKTGDQLDLTFARPALD